ALTFSITNRPSWASFNTSNGTLSGTPTSSNIGTYSNIVIRASDGTLSASLPAFAVTVAAVGNGSATLSWTPPTRNTDGTTLTNLPGYRIYYGTSSGSLTRTGQSANPGGAKARPQKPDTGDVVLLGTLVHDERRRKQCLEHGEQDGALRRGQLADW